MTGLVLGEQVFMEIEHIGVVILRDHHHITWPILSGDRFVIQGAQAQ